MISVIMAVYNAQRYLARAVESILAQTYEDFEFIIVDDGSTDGSHAILRRYADRDPRIRLVSRPNVGLVRTLNEMLAMAKGDLIARMDADDISLPGRFAAQVEFLEAHPEVCCLGGATEWIDEAGHTLLVNRHSLDDATLQEEALSGICPFCHPAVMMRRDVLVAIGGYDETMSASEDHDLWLRLGEVSRLANLEQVVLKYRLHGASATQQKQEIGRALVKAAVDRSCERRGLDRRCPPLEFNRCDPSPFECSLTYGWWGFSAGHRSAAIYHGARAVRRKPWHPRGWKLLASGLLKTPAPSPARQPRENAP